MAKSIRSKIMKRHRAFLRKTVGEAQIKKNLRKSLRQLSKAVTKQDAEALVEDSTMAGLAGALGGAGVPAASASASSGIKTIAGPERTKKLRYSFNTSLREARLAADLEDLTDDEDEVRLADKIALAKGLVGGGGATAAAEGDDGAEDDDAEDEVAEAGVKKGADKPVPKRENSSKLADNFREGPVGFYESDPALANPKRQQTHRKGKYKTEKAKFRFWES